MMNNLNSKQSKHGTNVNYKVRGAKCVDNIVFFYLYHKSRGYSMSKIVNLFTDNTNLNDCNVACYVKKHFNVIIENQPVCGLNQCCKALLK